MIEILTFINHLKELQKLDKEDVQKAIDRAIERHEDPKIFN